jgi:hypothetical protein
LREPVGVGDGGPEQRQVVWLRHGRDDLRCELQEIPAQLIFAARRYLLHRLQCASLRVLYGQIAHDASEELLLAQIMGVEGPLGDLRLRCYRVSARSSEAITQKHPPGTG